MPSFIVKPKDLKGLWQTLPSLPADRKYLAGGTDLVSSSNAGAASAQCWIDISALSELRAIKETRSSLFIGSAVKISEIENSPAARKWCPALIAAIPHFASPSLRNMATLGGNAANASPCADGVCALVSERALICLDLRGKKRKLPLSGFLLGPKKTALKKDELITGFEIPKWKHAASYQKLGPRSYFGISKAAVAASCDNKKVSIALASVGPVTIYAARTSAYLSGKKLTDEVTAKASELVKTEAAPITDARSEAAYRREMCGVLLERALRALSETCHPRNKIQ